jgi:hypothetical protein
MKTQKDKEIKNQFEKEQLKCVNEAIINNDWNPKHFMYCKADVLFAQLKGRKEARKEVIEEFKLWLEQFEKVVNWHKERSLLPYDWNEYEHKKIIELREILKEIKNAN